MGMLGAKGSPLPLCILPRRIAQRDVAARPRRIDRWSECFFIHAEAHHRLNRVGESQESRGRLYRTTYRCRAVGSYLVSPPSSFIPPPSYTHTHTRARTHTQSACTRASAKSWRLSTFSSGNQHRPSSGKPPPAWQSKPLFTIEANKTAQACPTTRATLMRALLCATLVRPSVRPLYKGCQSGSLMSPARHRARIWYS